jgi:hypothetical protein
MAGVTISDQWDALLTTTARNHSKAIPDAISKNKKFYFAVKRAGGYTSEDSLGYDVILPVRYANKTSQTMGPYDEVDVTPIEGATVSRWDWAQSASSVTISDKEVAQNSGDNQKIKLVTLKMEQATDGITEDFNRRTLAGNGENVSSQITTAHTENGSTFVTPLPAIVAKTPTNTVGGLSGTTYTWWKNKTADATDTSFATQLHSLRSLRLNCEKGVGGGPDFHLVDENVYLWYEKALAKDHRNPSYQKGDVPFQSLAFYGEAVVWDEDMPEWDNGDTALDTAKGTWVMLNMKFLKVKYDPTANFDVGPFIRPHNQLVKTALVSWRGALCTSNRAKHGVLYGIDTTVAS